MSEWIVAAASSAVWPSRSVHARVSFSPAVKNVIRPSASLQAAARPRPAPTARRGTRRPPRPKALPAPPRACSRSPRSVLDRDQRLRRQRVELRRAARRPVGERLPGVEVREERGERLHLGALRRVAGLRLLLDPLVSPLDVVAVGDEELELQRLEVVAGRRVIREAVEHGKDRVDLAEVPEELRPGAGDVDDADRGGRHLLRMDERGEPVEVLVGDRGHADVGLVGHGRIRRDLRPRVGQRVEQRRLAAVR